MSLRFLQIGRAQLSKIKPISQTRLCTQYLCRPKLSAGTKAAAKLAAKKAAVQRKRCAELCRQGTKPREKVRDVVLRGHTAGLAYTGGSDKAFFRLRLRLV